MQAHLCQTGDNTKAGGQTEQTDVNRCITNTRSLNCSQLCTSASATYQNSAPASSLGITISDRDSNRVSHSCISPRTLQAAWRPLCSPGLWWVRCCTAQLRASLPSPLIFFFSNALIDSFQYHKTDHMFPLKQLQGDILDVRNRFIVGSLNTKSQ